MTNTNILNVMDPDQLAKNGQYAYDSIVENYRAFQNEDFASFILGVAIESIQSVLSDQQFEYIFGVPLQGYGTDVAHAFRQASEEIEDILGIEEFPGYDDYWVSIAFSEDNGLLVKLHVGLPEFSYYMKPSDGTDIQEVPFISDFRTHLSNYISSRFSHQGEYVAVSEDVKSTIYRSDNLPMKDAEIDFLNSCLKRGNL